MSWVVELLRLIVADIALVAGISIVVGAIAPWVFGSALERNVLPLLPFESPSFYRRLGVSRWVHRLPEFGAVFGGRSKRILHGSDTASLQAYLVEVRRAEIVHVISSLSWVTLIGFNPWWLTLAFAIVVVAVNLPFLVILRNNHVRLERALARREK